MASYCHFIRLSPQAVSTSWETLYFLSSGKKKKTKKNNLSVCVCLREETETGPESHRGTVYFGNEMSVAGGPNLLDDRTALGGGTDEKWTDSRMVILS